MYLLPRVVGWTACPWSATGYVGTCDATNGPTLCKSWYREFGPDSYWPMYLVSSCADAVQIGTDHGRASAVLLTCRDVRNWPSL